MPFNVLAEHAEKHVRTDPRFDPVTHRPDLQIPCLRGMELLKCFDGVALRARRREGRTDRNLDLLTLTQLARRLCRDQES